VESPRNKAVLNLAYKWGNFGISATTTYTGRVTLDDQFLVSAFDNPRICRRSVRTPPPTSS
jgi:hypothetical protein